jgi:2-succinyl-5-enolpyruvyl-6-hydroxy-3-cyclohexene-1-carboxylate synthase
VAALRGVAGIDGTVSFAAGLAGGRDPETPTRVLLGDLALAHDLGGMVVPALERRPELQIVVMDDSGGGIFETLEPAGVGLEDAFERFFATPVKLDWAAAASAVGAEFAEAHTLDQLRSALATPPPGLSLVRVPLARAARRGMEARAVELSRKRLNLPRKLP